MNIDNSKPATPKGDVGTRLYTSFFLTFIYNPLVTFNFRFFWRCPFPLLQRFFIQHLSLRHLDVGTGTGYFPIGALDELSPKGKNDAKYSMTLCDLNAPSLETTAARILKRHPGVAIDTVLADATRKPIPALEGRVFDSISLFNLLHCIPGGLERKLAVFGVLAPHLSDNGVLFGCTALGQGVHMSAGAKVLTTILNRYGVFTNWDDSAAAFEQALRAHFDEVDLKIQGVVLIFTARKPRRT